MKSQPTPSGSSPVLQKISVAPAGEDFNSMSLDPFMEWSFDF